MIANKLNTRLLIRTRSSKGNPICNLTFQSLSSTISDDPPCPWPYRISGPTTAPGSYTVIEVPLDRPTHGGLRRRPSSSQTAALPLRERTVIPRVPGTSPRAKNRALGEANLPRVLHSGKNCTRGRRAHEKEKLHLTATTDGAVYKKIEKTLPRVPSPSTRGR
jgi:hypothetical protein